MFQAEHANTSYAKPQFRQRPPENRSFRQVLKRIVAFTEVQANPTAIQLTDSDRSGLDDFLRQYEATRHQLLLRKVRGEELTPVEEAVLSALNSELEAHLPHPTRRSAGVTAAVEEAKRILASLKHGDD